MSRTKEVGHLHEGDEFVDASDIPHVVRGFRFHPELPGLVTIVTDHRPLGVVMDSTALVVVL